MPDDPFSLFRAWYAEAGRDARIKDASAMALATADAAGRPSVRMVLLKDVDERGFVFYTHLTSPKAGDLRINPVAEVCFHWAPEGRQVRVHGSVAPVAAEEADAYFATRPRLSQLGAWASAQSSPMPHGLALASAVAEAAVRFPLGPVPRPPHWSGFRLAPEWIEFWREGPFRRHDRVRYARADGGWRSERLFP